MKRVGNLILEKQVLLINLFVSIIIICTHRSFTICVILYGGFLLAYIFHNCVTSKRLRFSVTYVQSTEIVVALSTSRLLLLFRPHLIFLILLEIPHTLSGVPYCFYSYYTYEVYDVGTATLLRAKIKDS